MKDLKQKLHKHCMNLVREKILQAEKELALLKESLYEEVKCSCGDKHEIFIFLRKISYNVIP